MQKSTHWMHVPFRRLAPTYSFPNGDHLAMDPISLPLDIFLQVLKHLPISNLGYLATISKEWKNVIDTNESSIYHSAAVLEGHISSTSITFSELSYSPHSMAGVEGWKDFSGMAQVLQLLFQNVVTGREVHRIKVDERRGIILTTSRHGGLRVVEMHSDKLLWSLPAAYVRPYAHCEYDEGYLVFDRPGNCKEVWRLTSECDNAGNKQSDRLYPPDERQRRISARDASVTTKGHFTAWALIQVPAPTRAFRFVFPMLLVSSSYDRMPVQFLWDLRTCQMVQTITQPPEISFIHVFICGTSLRIFSRTDGKCLLDLPARSSIYGKWRFEVQRTPYKPGTIVVPQNVILIANEAEFVLVDLFQAAHVSPSGRDLVALLSASRLLIIPDFERALNGSIPLRDITIDIQLGPIRGSSVYLAFDDGRAVAATTYGIFIVDFEQKAADQCPIVRVSRTCFRNRHHLSHISCLQLTETGLFINWDPEIGGEEDPFDETPDRMHHYMLVDDEMHCSMVCNIDFCPSETENRSRIIPVTDEF
ncbi:hypothetical protein C8J56DRAFT_933972 [Mycena floridula]|nr:hypothetical protein C8J56DRAFT_933972 [Mycena floridula]